MHVECAQREHVIKKATANNSWFLFQSALHLTSEFPSADYNSNGKWTNNNNEHFQIQITHTDHIILFKSDWDKLRSLAFAFKWHLSFNWDQAAHLSVTDIHWYITDVTVPCNDVKAEYPSMDVQDELFHWKYGINWDAHKLMPLKLKQPIELISGV